MSLSLTDDEFSEALAGVIADLVSEAITEAEAVTQLEILLPRWGRGGAGVNRAAAKASLAVSTLEEFLRLTNNWFAGTATGGPDSDGLFPVKDAAGNEYSLPSPAKLMATFRLAIDAEGTFAGRDAYDDEDEGFYYLSIDGAAGDGLGAVLYRHGVGSGVWGSAVPFQGEKGDKGDAATISVGTVTTGAAGSEAAVENVGDENDAVLNLTIPRGDKGDAATVAVGTVTTGAAGSPVSVTNAGTSAAAILNFVIPKGDQGDKGDAATVTIGTVTTGAAGSAAAVENVGDENNAVLNLTIPRGDTGATGTMEVGTVTTGTAGSAAAVENVGSSTAGVFNFVIPQGLPGAGLTPVGAWDVGTTYDTGDAVSHVGASYASLVDSNVGIEPGVTSGWASSWMVVADPGAGITMGDVSGLLAELADMRADAVEYGDRFITRHTLVTEAGTVYPGEEIMLKGDTPYTVDLSAWVEGDVFDITVTGTAAKVVDPGASNTIIDVTGDTTPAAGDTISMAPGESYRLLALDATTLRPEAR